MRKNLCLESESDQLLDSSVRRIPDEGKQCFSGLGRSRCLPASNSRDKRQPEVMLKREGLENFINIFLYF